MAKENETKKKINKTDKKTVTKNATDKKAVKKVEPKRKIDTSIGAQVLRWQAPDYYTFERSPYWSLFVGVIAIILASVLIYTENFFPVIIVILAVIVSFQVAHEKPKTQEFAIDESGLLCRNNYIPFSELKSFWIASHGNKSLLYVEPANPLKSPVSMPLGQQKETEIRYFLVQFLPEKFEAGEMMSEKLIRIFKL